MTDSNQDIAAIAPTSPGYARDRLEGNTNLRELSWIGKINLRGNPQDKKFVDGASAAIGIDLPLEPNTTASTDDILVFWLGPDEWLIHCGLNKIAGLIEQLEAKLAGNQHAVTEVTDYFSVLELEGKAATSILARGCPLDLHESKFQSDQCAQTRFGTASVLLYKPDGGSRFLIQVRWSYTEYVWDYLVSVIKCL